MSQYVKKGTRVHRSARMRRFDTGMHYRAAYGVMLEDGRIGPDAGWDVYDLKLDSGREGSAYGFDLVRAKHGKVKPKKRAAQRSTHRAR